VSYAWGQFNVQRSCWTTSVESPPASDYEQNSF
jgi:hypothetical protein